MQTTGYDCLVIPGAKKQATTTASVPSKICGNLIVTMSGMTFPAMSVCCEWQRKVHFERCILRSSVSAMRCPFSIHFASDNFENAAMGDNTGTSSRQWLKIF